MSIRSLTTSVLVGLLFCCSVVRGNNISISLFAIGLSGCDTLSYCDPFVRVYCNSKLSDWTQCGETTKLVENNYPVWPDIFIFEHDDKNGENWEFKVIDDDNLFDDVIGSVIVNVNTFLNATQPSNSYEVDLNGRGRFLIRRNNA